MNPLSTCPQCSKSSEETILKTHEQAATGTIEGRPFNKIAMHAVKYTECGHICEERQYLVSDEGKPLGRGYVRPLHPEELADEEKKPATPDKNPAGK